MAVTQCSLSNVAELCFPQLENGGFWDFLEATPLQQCSPSSSVTYLYYFLTSVYLSHLFVHLILTNFFVCPPPHSLLGIQGVVMSLESFASGKG